MGKVVLQDFRDRQQCNSSLSRQETGVKRSWQIKPKEARNKRSSDQQRPSVRLVWLNRHPLQKTFLCCGLFLQVFAGAMLRSRHHDWYMCWYCVIVDFVLEAKGFLGWIIIDLSVS